VHPQPGATGGGASEIDDAKSPLLCGISGPVIWCLGKVPLATAEHWEAGAIPALPPQR